MSNPNPYGRDQRRHLSPAEARKLYERAGGICQRCEQPLDATWHAAHLVAHRNGGPTDGAGNMQAWCASCNLEVGAADVIGRLERPLRDWQAVALDTILGRIFSTGVATVHAAPGAGKTIFAGIVAQRLIAAGLIERVVVVVPNTNLVTQWTDSLSDNLHLHLDSRPRDLFLEHPNNCGLVVTYHSLPNTAVHHQAEAQRRLTLVILDEVHHVGEKRAWGKAVRTMIGDVADGDVHVAGLLNMTGTLFRSTGQLRISTVRYSRVVEDGQELWRADADYSIPTRLLIGKELRPTDLFAYSTQAQLVDLHAGTVTDADIADLEPPQRSAVKRELFTSREFVEGFCREAVKRLMLQQEHLGHDEPLKMLYVASNQQAAKRAADALNEATGDDFARLVISDEPGALKTLRRAARDKRSCAIVAVQMVTEGFDCPAVSTIAYASHYTARLFIAQTMARAMRITDAERAKGIVLPAQLLIPDDPALKEVFLWATAGTDAHTLKAEEPVQQQLAGPLHDGAPRLPRFSLIDLSAPTLRGATVLGEDDGDVSPEELAEVARHLKALHLDEVLAARVAVVTRRVRRFPRLYNTPAEPTAKTPTARELNPREHNIALRTRLKQMAGWMNFHVAHDDRFATIGVFQGMANDAAGLPTGGRDQADADQLASVIAWMTVRIAEHTATYEKCHAPEWLEDDPTQDVQHDDLPSQETLWP